ncbi:MAG: hypothetical protein D6701_06090 [Gemmatimonadetes bacterium]|nr:MAG: hypothetical protein D6701_06090 [Gemmatimonadota bacterium]
MRHNRWTVLFIRGEDAPIRQVDVPVRAVHYAASAVAGFLVVLASLVTLVVLDGSARAEARELARKNEVLRTEVEQIQSRVGDLEGVLARLSEQGDAFRVLAGLDGLDDEVLQVGVGGPGLRTPESTPLWGVDSVAGKAAFAAEYDLFALERRAGLLSESLAEATDSLRARRELLESTPSILPASGLLSSGFSRARLHPIHHKELPHQGIDLAAPAGTPILAAAKGTVSYAGWMSGYGYIVEIDHGYGYRTRYGHASELLVKRGQTVERGDVIARVGQTGFATAPHLHYEVLVDGKPQNPLNYVITDAIP